VLEQLPREPPEGRMIVDDQHRRAHGTIVTEGASESQPGFP
jgi:hypothetical protein